MKRLLTNFLLLLLSIPFFSYGMSGDEPGYDFFKDAEAWLSSSNWREKRRREKEADTEEHAPKRRALEPEQPLPPLTIVHEQATSPSSDNPNIEPGHSRLETLPAEIHARLIEFLPNQALQQLALVSHKLRDQAQGNVKQLTISVADITPKELGTIKNRFPNIKSLSVKGNGITPEHITLLAQTFPAITSLDLQETGLTLEGVRILAEPTAFTALKALNLSNNALDDEAIELLAYAPFANSLELLDLTSTGITGHAIKIFADSQQFTHLKDLRLAHNPIESILHDVNFGDIYTAEQENEGIRFLSETAFVNTLESLDLTDTNLTGYQLELFTKPGKFKAIKKLILGGNSDLTDMFNENEADVYGTYTYQYRSPFGILAQASFAPTLESLIFDGETNLNPSYLEDLKEPNLFPSLKVLRLTEHLNIGGDSHTESPITILSQTPLAKQLQELALPLLRREDLEALCSFENLRHLDTSYFAFDKFELERYWNGHFPTSSDIIDHLKAFPFAHQLEKIKIFSNMFTKEDRGKFDAESFPSLKSIEIIPYRE